MSICDDVDGDGEGSPIVSYAATRGECECSC